MVSGGVWETGGLEDDVQDLFRHKDDGTVVVHTWITHVRLNASMAKVCRDVELEDEDMPHWRIESLVKSGTGCLKMWRRETSSPKISCGRPRTSSSMWREKEKDEGPSLSHTFVSIAR